MITVKKLVKTFPSGKTAVDELDLSVNTGEIFALLGPNGAGKSTTIRVLATLSGFDSGAVNVAGFNVDTDPDSVRAAIGLVAQKTGIDYFLTGRENLHLSGQLYHMSKADILRRTQELAQYFELTEVLDKTAMTYSGGMQRKLDIATALMHSPKLLFLDEPTLGLDINSRQSLWRYIEKMNRELNLTILLTTHYLEEADKLSHRVGIINQGKICTIGTAEELKNSIGGDVITLAFAERNAQVDQFVGTIAQQGLSTQSLWQGSRVHLYTTDGAHNIPKIVGMAGQFGVTIDNLSLARPTLDDVFLRYTGTSLDGKTDEGGGNEWWQQWAGKGGGGKWAQKWQQENAEPKTGSATPTPWPTANNEAATTNAAPPAKDEATPTEQPAQSAWPQGPQDWEKWQQKGGQGDPSEGNKWSQQWQKKDDK